MDPLHVRLPRDLTSPATARRQIAALIQDASDSAQDVVRLLTTELVTNAVLHGDGAIDLSAHRHDNLLRIEVHDGSPAFPLPEESDMGAERGRGLCMVAELANGWGILEDQNGSGKTVWCNLLLDRGPGPARIVDGVWSERVWPDAAGRPSSAAN